MMDLVYWSRAVHEEREREAAKRRLIRLATEPETEDAAPVRRVLDPARTPASCEVTASTTMRCWLMGGCA